MTQMTQIQQATVYAITPMGRDCTVFGCAMPSVKSTLEALSIICQNLSESVKSA
jgi:hypothetical protein